MTRSITVITFSKSVKAKGADRRVRFLHVCGWDPLSEKFDCLNYV